MKLKELPWRRILQAYAISIAIWLPISVLVAWQMYSFEHRINPAMDVAHVMLVFGARHMSAALLTPPIFYIVSRWPVTDDVVRRTILYVLGSLPFAFAFAAIRLMLARPYYEETASWAPRSFTALLDLAFETFGDIFILYSGIVLAAHAYTYFVLGRRQEIERLQLRQALAQSELQTLRAQLHPHFLFNTLQGVSTLIDTNRVTAQTMLHTLAELLRKVLKYGSSDLIMFRDELAFVRGYLQLEQMRLGRRLTTRWKISPAVETALIPQLLLQPLIENAVMHGIASSAEGGWIEIEAELQRERLVVVIRNSMGGASERGHGIGISNTRARLKFLYGTDACFEFRTEGGAAVAELTIPAFVAPLAEAANA
jgi:two-component system, LytTR family, sensor kinase